MADDAALERSASPSAPALTGDEADERVALLCAKARAAARVLAMSPTESRRAALQAIADAVEGDAVGILAANADDVATAAVAGLSDAMLDRLRLDPDRIAGIVAGARSVAALPDPVGTRIDRTVRPNGLVLDRVRVPIGVIGMIYESRPNVTVDAAALAVMAGNAILLRGGSEAAGTNARLLAAVRAGLAAAGLPADAAQGMGAQDRALVGAMLRATGGIDVIIPRGGKSLVARVTAEARVPVLAHLDGVCHSYVDAAADPAMAVAVVLDAKLRRTGVCGATECLLIDAAYPVAARRALIAALLERGCAVRGDGAIQADDPRVVPASEDDWGTEYLAPILAARLVDGVAGAVAHIARHGSGHTDAIITGDERAAAAFLAGVDSAIVLHNASTQFADGGEFGLGAEIGIATGRLHARGPVALEGLTTYRWIGRGSGQVRG